MIVVIKFGLKFITINILMGFKKYIIENVPKLKVGDIVKVGKFKNKSVEIVSFGTDDKGQPTIITKSLKGRGGTKERKLFSFKIQLI